MSNISTIYDALDAAISGALGATHAELINPYVTEEESNLTLDAAYGFTIADATNLLLNEDSGVMTLQRNFELVLTRRKFATKGDIATRKTAEKNLLEDLQLVITAIKESAALQLAGTANVARYGTDPGAELLRVERGRNDIFAIRAIIEVQYTETYNLCF